MPELFRWEGISAQLNADLSYSLGNWVNPVPAGIIITKMKMYMHRTGSPLGNANFRIMSQNQVSPSYVYQFGSITCTDISTGGEWYEFTGAYQAPTAGKYRFVAYFDGDHTFPTHWIAVHQATPCDQDNGAKTTSLLLGGAFSDSAVNSYAAAMILEYSLPSGGGNLAEKMVRQQVI